MTSHEFPSAGFLILGVLSLGASVLFIVRAASVEATAERIWSAVVFGAMGILWLGAHWSSRHSPTH